MRRVLLPAALLAGAVLASPARATFFAPEELAAGPALLGAAADTDAAGATSVVVTGVAGGPLLVERTRDGVWGQGTPLPGSPPSVVGPVLDAAGNGALAIAWRVDRPSPYAGIDVAVRDPGGTLSQPIAVAGMGSGGVRHPAIAVDGGGDVLLAFNSVTGGTRHNVRGGIAIAYRRAGGPFPGGLVVDPAKSSAPVVALAPDGTGIVAWSRPRHVYAVSVDADGKLGAENVFRTSTAISSLHAAAGNDGAATLAWVSRPASAGPLRYRVTTVRRPAGHVFGAPATVTSTADVITTLAMAADETGQVTLAWNRQHNHVGGPTTAIVSATAAPGFPFGAPRQVAPPSGGYHTPPSIAAANGRVAIAWGSAADLRHIALKAAVGPAGAPGPPQTVTAKTLAHAIPAVPPVRATIDAGGTATVVYGEPVEATTGPPSFSWRVFAVDGR